MSKAEVGGSRVLGYLDHEVVTALEDFQDPSQEWRRLFSELLGTFFLVLVAAGGGMMGQAFPDTISRTAAVVAPGLMVMAIILFMGKVSGAHLNPAVSVAFSLRGDFPWRRVPGYIVVQLVGATLACLFLRAVIDVSATYGSNYPASGFSAGDAFLMEAVLTLGLVSVILGTASGAQNIGIFGAIGVGAYIALAGLWGSPISGASMNPARTFGPDLVGTDFTSYWVYVAGPLVGAALAVGSAWVLRGAGGGRAGSAAAQGDHPDGGRAPGQGITAARLEPREGARRAPSDDTSRMARPVTAPAPAGKPAIRARARGASARVPASPASPSRPVARTLRCGSARGDGEARGRRRSRGLQPAPGRGAMITRGCLDSSRSPIASSDHERRGSGSGRRGAWPHGRRS